MVFKAFSTLALAAGLALVSLPAAAGEYANQIGARQAQMKLYAFNIGQLGAMAKGEVEYNAEAASAAAGNLVTLTSLNGSMLWPQGSDNASDGTSYAKADLWANFPDVMAKSGALKEAAAAMNDAAGKDLDSLRAAMGALGGACQECHKAYRVPKQ